MTSSPNAAYIISGKHHLQRLADAQKSTLATPAPVGSTCEYLSEYCSITGATAKAHFLTSRDTSIVLSLPSPLTPPRNIGTPFFSPITTSSGKYCEPTLTFHASTHRSCGKSIRSDLIISSRLAFSDDVNPND